MTNDESFDPEDREAREVAAVARPEQKEFLSLAPHYYRGEVGRMSTHLSRLDLSTDWAIVFLTPSSHSRSEASTARRISS